ncbi:MAG: hypothetical protein HY652_02775 [Acidobacteria bacterium]|nr:hypothetical protein [Acidobacteriota bacterium]
MKNFVTKDLSLKVVALGLAVLLWLSLSGEEYLEQALSIPVQYYGTPADLEYTSELVQTVDVHIRSSRNIKISESNIAAVVDLRDAKPGRKIIPLTADAIRLPSGVQVLKVTPPRLTVDLERTARKTVPVHPDIQGVPAEGFEVTKVTVQPPTVNIEGPSSKVERVNGSVTETVNVSGYSSDYSAVVNVTLEDSFVRLERPAQVEVRVQIRERRFPQVIENIPVQPTNTQYSAVVSPREIDVTARVPKSLAGKRQPILLSAHVDLTGLEPRRLPYQVEPQVVVAPEVADQVTIVSKWPQTVSVRIQVAKR